MGRERKNKVDNPSPADGGCTHGCGYKVALVSSPGGGLAVLPWRRNGFCCNGCETKPREHGPECSLVSHHCHGQERQSSLRRKVNVYTHFDRPIKEMIMMPEISKTDGGQQARAPAATQGPIVETAASKSSPASNKARTPVVAKNAKSKRQGASASTRESWNTRILAYGNPTTRGNDDDDVEDKNQHLRPPGMPPMFPPAKWKKFDVDALEQRKKREGNDAIGQSGHTSAAISMAPLSTKKTPKTAETTYIQRTKKIDPWQGRASAAAARGSKETESKSSSASKKKARYSSTDETSEAEATATERKERAVRLRVIDNNINTSMIKRVGDLCSMRQVVPGDNNVDSKSNSRSSRSSNNAGSGKDDSATATRRGGGWDTEDMVFNYKKFPEALMVRAFIHRGAALAALGVQLPIDNNPLTAYILDYTLCEAGCWEHAFGTLRDEWHGSTKRGHCPFAESDAPAATRGDFTAYLRRTCGHEIWIQLLIATGSWTAGTYAAVREEVDLREKLRRKGLFIPTSTLVGHVIARLKRAGC